MVKTKPVTSVTTVSEITPDDPHYSLPAITTGSRSS
jgi:hypothetical protein